MKQALQPPTPNPSLEGSGAPRPGSQSGSELSDPMGPLPPSSPAIMWCCSGGGGVDTVPVLQLVQCNMQQL